MTSASGDRFAIRIGGDASGPVVAGRENHIEVHHGQPDSQVDSVPSGGRQNPRSTQTNTANDHGTVCTVMNGELHIHHNSPEAPSDQ